MEEFSTLDVSVILAEEQVGSLAVKQAVRIGAWHSAAATRPLGDMILLRIEVPGGP